jgi:hypothetical protein
MYQPDGQSEAADLLLLDIDEFVSHLEEMLGRMLRRKKAEAKEEE